jgi:hypothetical protein
MNTYIIEWAWLVVAALGWVIKVFLLGSARANYRHHRAGETVHVFMAKSVYFHMCHMVIAFTICVAAALWAVTHQPPPPPIYQTQSFAIAVFFMSLTVVLTTHALLVSRWWNKLEDGRYNGEDHSNNVVTTVETKISSNTSPTIQVTRNGQTMDDG